MTLELFSEAQFQHDLQRNVRALARGKFKSIQPRAILLGGQSGAGKTTIHRIKQKEFQGNIIIIDGDSYRSQHPNYIALQEKYGKESVDYTKVFAGKMVEGLINELSHLGYDLLIEGTLRTTEVPRKTGQLLKTRGYQVALALIATKSELSYLSTLIRYEELYAIDPSQARATAKEYHDGIFNHLVENLREIENEQLFDHIQMYQRDRQCVYDSKIKDHSAIVTLEEVFFGQWTTIEKEMFVKGKHQLEELRKKNEYEHFEN